jgi:hypothetical protein
VQLHLKKETRLYFAGEATHKSDAYSVHGAMMSGRREGKRIGGNSIMVILPSNSIIDLIEKYL